MKFLMENKDNSDIELYYDSLPVTLYGGKMDWDTGCYDERDVEIEWTYLADRGLVEDFLMKYLPEEIQNADEDVIDKYFEDNIDDLVEKYNQELLDHFEDDAIEDAQENNDEDYDTFGYDPDAEYDAWVDDQIVNGTWRNEDND